MGTADDTIKSLGIDIPEAKTPEGAAYVPYVLHRGTVTISGQLPMQEGALTHVGKLGREFDVAQGQDCARICGMNILSQLRAACDGD